ncbi:MAG: TolC family protein, partial [Bacteroidia bacterium]|nr:TolC family protein [Bacteroidia bacterium]
MSNCILKSLLITFVLTSVFEYTIGQNLGNSITMTLPEVVERAKIHSPDARAANNKFKNSYWKYRSYKANYLPLVNLSATTPDLNRSISRITLDDGTEAFIETSSANS